MNIDEIKKELSALLEFFEINSKMPQIYLSTFHKNMEDLVALKYNYLYYLEHKDKVGTYE